MTQAQRMRKAIDRIILPKLQEAGFTGKYPHFRRERGDVIDMVAFVPCKYGNGFEVGGSVIFPREKPDRQNILRPTKPIDEKPHPEWKAFARREIGEMNLYDTSMRNVLPGMGWNGHAFYYSDVYKKPWNIMFGTEYFPVGEQAAKTFVPQKDMKLAQKATPELTEQIAQMACQQLDGLLAWFDQIQCWKDLEQWGETKYGKRHSYDKIKKTFRKIVEHW